MKEKILFLVFVAGLLAGCANTNTGATSQVTSFESSTTLSSQTTTYNHSNPSEDDADRNELRLLTAQHGIVMTVGGETQDGCYSLDTYPDGTADIIFYDYQTKQCVRLSSDANLKHDPASSAYLPSFKGGARCLVAGENLYVIKSGQPYTDASVPGNDPIARIYCMTLNGSERTVMEYGSNVVFQWDACVAGDSEGALYTVLAVVDPKTTHTKYVLARLGKGIDGYETISEWDDEATVRLMGVCDSGFVISKTYASEQGTKKLLEIYQKSGEPAQTLLEWDNTEVTGFTVFDNILYYTKSNDALIYTKSTSESHTVSTIDTSCFVDFKPSIAIISSEVRDNHLILQLIQDEVHASYAALDIPSEKISPLLLYEGEGDEKTFVGIFAEGQDDFLVRIGKFTRSRTDYGLDGTMYRYDQGFEDYVLISKQDYWNNKADYQRFDYYN